MTNLRISAWLGVALSVVGAALKIVRVVRQTEWWPFVAYDYIAILLLLVGAWIVLRRGGSGVWLAAGWGFGVAMTYGSFFGHLEAWITKSRPDLAFEHSMAVSVGVLLAVNTLGLVLALWPAADLRARAAAQAAS